MSSPPSSAPTATGWSDSCRAGFAPAERRRLSRRTSTGCYGSGFQASGSSCSGTRYSPPACRTRAKLVRASLRRLLARGRRLGFGSAAAAAALAWRVGRNKPSGRPPPTRWCSRSARSCLFLLLAAAARGHLAARLDAWLYPDTADQRQVLADVLAKVGRTRAVGRIVRRTAKRGCGTPPSPCWSGPPAPRPRLACPTGAVAPSAPAPPRRLRRRHSTHRGAADPRHVRGLSPLSSS